jgi:hypothetical protein
MSELDTIARKIISALETKNAARAQALTSSRKVIQHSAYHSRCCVQAGEGEANLVTGGTQVLYASAHTRCIL